jgi:hypothetical protein
MAGPFLSRDTELLIKAESAWGTDPTPAGTDAFVHKVLAGFGFTKVIARFDRDKDRSPLVADVLTAHKGREHSTFQVDCDVVPSGNASTPTAPDIDPLLYSLFGAHSTLTAHTTTAAGSAGTSIVLTTGGGAASGIPVGGGCLIACDVSTAVGVEVRYVVSRTTDTLTIDRAFTTDPAAGRAVYVGTTYTLTQTATISAYIKAYMGGGDNARYAVPGAIVQSGVLSINGAQDTPVAGFSFSGLGSAVTTHTLTRPTMTTAGVPLIPTASKVWIGASAAAKIVNAELAVKNILDLRMNDIGSLAPVGVKRTANGSRYDNQMKLDILLESGTIEGYYTNNASLTAYDVIVQLGVAPGAMVAWRCRNWIPDTPLGDVDGEVAINAAGRCYGSSGDDSVVLTVF